MYPRVYTHRLTLVTCIYAGMYISIHIYIWCGTSFLLWGEQVSRVYTRVIAYMYIYTYILAYIHIKIYLHPLAGSC